MLILLCFDTMGKKDVKFREGFYAFFLDVYE